MSSCVHVVVKGTCAVRNLRAEFQLTNVAGWIKWIVDSRLGKKKSILASFWGQMKNLIKDAFKQNSPL